MSYITALYLPYFINILNIFSTFYLKFQHFLVPFSKPIQSIAVEVKVVLGRQITDHRHMQTDS